MRLTGMGSEQAERLVAVADEEVLGLAVVVEHHSVVLAADAGDLVTAERRARRVLVVAVRPHPAGLDAAAHPVRAAAVPGPDARAQPVQGVVRDRQRLGLVLERRDGQYRAEDLLLEDTHRVVTAQNGRLEVVAVLELPGDLRAL